MSTHSDDLTPPSTDLPDWQADHDRECDEKRALIANHLADARVAINRAISGIDYLANVAYDVEVAEGDGQYAADTLRQMLVTLAGVRATTVDAGR